MSRKIDLDLSEKQLTALEFLNQHDKAVELLYGGAKGGGKSVFGCLWAWSEAERLLNLYKLPRTSNPMPVGFIGRKVGKLFNETTFETWKKRVPPECYVLKGKPAEIIIEGRVKIFTGGLDNRDDVNKFNSAELAFYFLDQAEETVKNDILLLRAATFYRLTIHGHKIPGKGLLTANPAQCWLKDEFIDIPGVAA